MGKPSLSSMRKFADGSPKHGNGLDFSKPNKMLEVDQELELELDSSEPEFTLKKLNSLIKSQIRAFLIPQELERESSTPKRKQSKSSSKSSSKIDWLRVLELFLINVIMFFAMFITFPPLGLNACFRWAINFLLKWRSNGKVRLMRGEDAFWASESEFNPGNFTSMYVIEGIPDLEKIRKRLGASWVERKDKQGRPMFTKLKLKAVQRASYFAWEYDEHFNLNNHVRYLNPQDPNRQIGESQLFQEIQSIYDNILPDDKPQWEILLVPNYVYDSSPNSNSNGKRHYALIFRVHHSIMDGLSAAQALRLVVADNVVEAGLDPMKPLRAPWWQKVIVYFFAIFLIGPYILRHHYKKKESNGFHGPNLTGPKTLGWSRPISMEAVKKLKVATKSSVTAVFISCIGGAFRKLAEAKGHPTPEKLTAVTCAAFIPYPSIKAQNRFCVLFTPIDAHVRDSKERVRLAQIPFDKKLEGSAEVVMAYWITWVGGCLPIWMLNYLQDGICQGTILLSNLPGPKTTAQIFGGDPIIDIVGWSPIRNRIGTAMCLFGYNGRVRANVIADSSVFPDPSDVPKFISEFESELLELGKHFGIREEDCFTSSRNNNATVNNDDGFFHKNRPQLLQRFQGKIKL